MGSITADIIYPNADSFTLASGQSCSDAGLAIGINTDGTVQVATDGTTLPVIGSSRQAQTTAGGCLAVNLAGAIIEVKAAGTFNAGLALKPTTGGEWTNTTTVGDYVPVIALEPGVQDRVIKALCLGHARYAATS